MFFPIVALAGPHDIANPSAGRQPGTYSICHVKKYCVYGVEPSFPSVRSKLPLASASSRCFSRRLSCLPLVGLYTRILNFSILKLSRYFLLPNRIVLQLFTVNAFDSTGTTAVESICTFTPYFLFSYVDRSSTSS